MNDLLLLFLSLSLSGSLLALLLFALRPLFQRRLSRGWQYYIWLIVVLRLLVPFGVPGGVVGGLFSRTEAGLERAKAAFAQEQPVQAEAVAPFSSTGDPSPAPVPEAGERVQPVQRRDWGALIESLWLFWLTGAFFLLVKKITGYRAFLGYIRAGCRQVDDERILERYRRELRELGIRRPPPLFHNPLASAPMLAGVLRPFIVLPDLEEGDIDGVLLHELTHYRRLDILYKWLVQIAVCLHWYNPLVYRISGEINRLCELACDEAVIRSMGEDEKFRYGDTLLATIRPDKGYSSAIVSITLNEDIDKLKERLDAIMDYRRISRPCRFLSAGAAVLLLTAASLSGVYAATDSGASAPAAAQVTRLEQGAGGGRVLTGGSVTFLHNGAAYTPREVYESDALLVAASNTGRQFLLGSLSNEVQDGLHLREFTGMQGMWFYYDITTSQARQVTLGGRIEVTAGKGKFVAVANSSALVPVTVSGDSLTVDCPAGTTRLGFICYDADGVIGLRAPIQPGVSAAAVDDAPVGAGTAGTAGAEGGGVNANPPPANAVYSNYFYLPGLPKSYHTGELYYDDETLALFLSFVPQGEVASKTLYQVDGDLYRFGGLEGFVSLFDITAPAATQITLTGAIDITGPHKFVAMHNYADITELVPDATGSMTVHCPQGTTRVAFLALDATGSFQINPPSAAGIQITRPAGGASPDSPSGNSLMTNAPQGYQYIHKELSEFDLSGLSEADLQGVNIMYYSGTWGQGIEALLPHMSNRAIDIVVEIYNSRNWNEQKRAADYYN